MFTKDTRTETFLTTFGANWRYTNKAQFHELAPDWQDTNLGRPQAKIDEAVTSYASLMEAGSAAPAPILCADVNGHQVADGVQRLLAADLRGEKSFSAYIVTTDSAQLILTLRVFANHRLQGSYQPDEEYSLDTAIRHLVTPGTLSVEEVAHLGGWRVATVRDREQLLRWRDAIEAIGGPAGLPNSIVKTVSAHAELSDLQIAPEPIAAFLRAVKDGRLSNGDALPYVDLMFTVNRRGKLFEQLLANWLKIQNDQEFKLRSEHVRRGPKLPIDVLIAKALKTALTTITTARRSARPILYVDEFLHLADKIRGELEALKKQSRKHKART